MIVLEKNEIVKILTRRSVQSLSDVISEKFSIEESERINARMERIATELAEVVMGQFNEADLKLLLELEKHENPA